MKSMKALIVAVMVFSIVLAGCSDNSTKTSADEGNNSKHTSRTLTIGLPQDVKTMDLYAFNDHVSWMAINNMYNTLYKRNTRGDVVPDLAESYKNIDDTTWEFVLKEGVKFHNGDELTAEDVKFSLERAATDETLLENSAYKSITEVKVVDPHTVQIITAEPNPLLLGVVARTSAAIYPKKYIDEKGIEYFNEHPVGTGPFKFVEWQRGSHVTFEPFEDYYEGAVKDWNKLVFRILPEASTRVGELLTGGVDIIPGVASNDWERIESNENTKLVSSVTNRVAHMVPKATPGSPMADPRVREAVELAIDKNLIIEKLFGGEGTPVRTRITPGNFGANEKLFDVALYDVDRAKKLLAEAGYKDGLELTIQSSSGRYNRDKEVAEMVGAMLENVGIKVNMEFPEWNTYLELRRANKVADLHMLWFGNSYFDAHIMTSEHITGTRNMENLGYDNPELLDILNKAKSNMNQEERAELYQQAQEIEAEERMRIYLYLEHKVDGVNNEVNFQPRLDEMFKAYDISLNE